MGDGSVEYKIGPRVRSWDDKSVRGDILIKGGPKCARRAGMHMQSACRTQEENISAPFNVILSSSLGHLIGVLIHRLSLLTNSQW